MVKVRKRDRGRLISYMGCNRAANTVQFGRIASVKNGIVEIDSSYLTEDDGRQISCPEYRGFRTLMPIDDPRIVKIHN